MRKTKKLGDLISELISIRNDIEKANQMIDKEFSRWKVNRFSIRHCYEYRDILNEELKKIINKINKYGK